MIVNNFLSYILSLHSTENKVFEKYVIDLIKSLFSFWDKTSIET
jgi:hypothetical protein